MNPENHFTFAGLRFVAHLNRETRSERPIVVFRMRMDHGALEPIFSSISVDANIPSHLRMEELVEMWTNNLSMEALDSIRPLTDMLVSELMEAEREEFGRFNGWIRRCMIVGEETLPAGHRTRADIDGLLRAGQVRRRAGDITGWDQLLPTGRFPVGLGDVAQTVAVGPEVADARIPLVADEMADLPTFARPRPIAPTAVLTNDHLEDVYRQLTAAQAERIIAAAEQAQTEEVPF